MGGGPNEFVRLRAATSSSLFQAALVGSPAPPVHHHSCLPTVACADLHGEVHGICQDAGCFTYCLEPATCVVRVKIRSIFILFPFNILVFSIFLKPALFVSI